MPHQNDTDLIQHTHNTSRFFVEHRQIAWVALFAVVAWGIYGYFSMPQKKDPEIPVRLAVAVCTWPGATAQQVEQLVTRPIEETIAQNKTIHPTGPDTYGIRSISLPGSSFVYVQLSDSTKNTREQFSDINLRLQGLNGRLPQGASPVQFQSDFGDTATLMLTVASPMVSGLEIETRAHSLQAAIRDARSAASSSLPRVSIVYLFPLALSETEIANITEKFRRSAERAGLLKDSRVLSGPGFSGIDAVSVSSDAQLRAYIKRYVDEQLQESEFDPDLDGPVIIHEPGETAHAIASLASAKYSYKELDDYSEFLARALLNVPEASRVERKGVLPQTIYLNYSQERLAAYGLRPSDLSRVLNAENITQPSGTLEAGGQRVILNASGQFESAKAIGNAAIATSAQGAPVYLRDVAQISRGYKSPANYLNFYSWTDSSGTAHRSRAVTLALYMRSGEQIQRFGKSVDEKLSQLKGILPPDLIIARTSDQPLQVRENIDLFMDALYEAVALVVIIALIGFWEWRSALLMALSIPITLAMTFGLAHTFNVDLQQVSIATLIIALGLLVDDPVVANDAIKRELAGGLSPLHASWIGPTKLARAIVYATITNIIAYLPFLMLKGTTGDFLYSLPIVMTAALVSSRLASMTFIPLLGYYLLRAPKKQEPTLEERRTRGFYGFYYRLAGTAIRHRWVVFALSILFLIAGLSMAKLLKSQFFPEDVQYWSYLDVWLPNDVPLAVTNETTQKAEKVIRRVVSEYEQHHPFKNEHGQTDHLLKAINTFVGGGGPRFWFSVSPELQQLNYAQVIIQLNSKEATPEIMGPLQDALSREIPGTKMIAHQLQTNPVEFPIEVRLFKVSDYDNKVENDSNQELRHLAGQVEDILRTLPGTSAVLNDWFSEGPATHLKIDTDRANLSGITNYDVSASATAAMSGTTVTTLREGKLQIPVVARLRMQERAQLSDIENLYVFSSQSQQRVPLKSVSTLEHQLETQRVRRQEHFRMIGVHAYPHPGVLASELLSEAMPKLREFEHNLPPGYRVEIGGEQAKQKTGFINLSQVLLISLGGIYLALLLQFNNAVKPLLVFAATPYGVVGALIALAVMGIPFGFMAFLGIASLIGVIISHVIVLFDFIEEMHEKGEPFEQAICDAGIERLRPVLITVGATIFALFPLAAHGGPLWQPLCYAQIGGLAVATFITLLLVPVLYSIAVLDLKIVRWNVPQSSAALSVENNDRQEGGTSHTNSPGSKAAVLRTDGQDQATLDQAEQQNEIA